MASEPRDAPLTVDQMKLGISRIQKRIDELDTFGPESVSARYSPEVSALETAIDETLAAVFGQGTAAYKRYKGAASLDNGPLVFGQQPSILVVRTYLNDGKRKAILLLKQAVRGLEEEIANQKFVGEPIGPEAVRDLSKVFIVHGHDGEVRESVARFLSEKLGLEPVILHERPNKGRTIITKFREEAAGVGFAVVLMTPDDLGKASAAADLKPRARQNVVFEPGFLLEHSDPSALPPS